MKTFYVATALTLFAGFQSGTAIPTPNRAGNGQGAAEGNAQVLQLLQSSGVRGLSASDLTTLLSSLNAQGANCAEAGAEAEAGAGKGEGEAAAGGGEGEAAAGEGEGEGNEVEIEAAFDTATAVQGGDLKQDLVFTKSTVGSFEFEFQNDVADEITVTENKTPAPPPTGFEAIEPSSYKVSLAASKGAGLTLSKIDFIFDPASPELAGKDITQSQVGRLCPDTGAFVISETLGELEFEAEENEVTLNLNKNVTAEAEWGIFLPVAAAAAPAAEAPAAEAPAAEAPAAEAPAAEAPATKAPAAEAPAKAKGKGKAEEEDDD